MVFIYFNFGLVWPFSGPLNRAFLKAALPWPFGPVWPSPGLLVDSKFDLQSNDMHISMFWGHFRRKPRFTAIVTRRLVAVYLLVDSKLDLQSNDMHIIGVRGHFWGKPRFTAKIPTGRKIPSVKIFLFPRGTCSKKNFLKKSTQLKVRKHHDIKKSRSL